MVEQEGLSFLSRMLCQKPHFHQPSFATTTTKYVVLRMRALIIQVEKKFDGYFFQTPQASLSHNNP